MKQNKLISYKKLCDKLKGTNNTLERIRFEKNGSRTTYLYRYNGKFMSLKEIYKKIMENKND